MYQTMGRLLKAEKDLFAKVEGGEELYQMLCEIFKVNEDKNSKENANHQLT